MVEKHVESKMIVESAQILSNCFTEQQLADPSCPRTQKGTPRKHSYPHHPCCKWVQQSKSNMRWLIEHAYALDGERRARWAVKQPDEECGDHFSMSFIEWCDKNINISGAPDYPMTPFVQCMPDEYKDPDTVTAYRNYYKHGKVHLHKWTRNRPVWC